MTYTLGEAAKATGLTKPTLSKAIKSGKLSAVRNENGSYTIDPAELHRVFPPVSSNQQNECKPLRLETPLQLVQMLEKEQEERERERRHLENQIDDLRRRLDEEAAERRKLTALLTHHQQPPAETARPGFWRRLFGSR